MWEGAVIFLVGAVVGYLVTTYLPPKEKKSTENPYDKYKSPDGLYSVKAIKAAKESR